MLASKLRFFCANEQKKTQKSVKKLKHISNFALK